MMPEDAVTLAQKWGFGAFFFGAAILFYKLWKTSAEKNEQQMNLRISERDEHIRALKEELVRERTSNRD